MIKGMHVGLNTPKAEEVRAFMRNKLGFPYSDPGNGWLIFDPPEGDIGANPSEKISYTVSFYCDDFHKTTKELKLRGVECTSAITDEGW